MTGDKIRVVLADDHAVVRAGLKAVLGGAKDIEVIGEAKTGREAVTLAERFKPDVIIMDLSMPELDGTAATKEIVAKGLPVKVLILTMHVEDD
jgi:two-component system response regulator NreC